MCIKLFAQSALYGISIGILVLLLASCAPAEPDKGLLDVGDLLPELTFSSLQGNSYSTKQFAGQVVILNFWASWCGPCRKEMPSLQRLSETLDPTRFKVIGISVDDDANLAKEFLTQHNIHFRNLHDPYQTQAINRFGISAYPETLIISAKGIILRKVLGEQAWDSPGMIAMLESMSLHQTKPLGSFAYGKKMNTIK